MKQNQQGWITKLSAILILVSIVIIYATHRYVPFMMDDDWYATNLVTGESLKSFKDIVESQIWHYFNWGGRSMTHSILQLTILSGEWMADILNVCVTLLLAGVVLLVADAKKLPYFFAALGMLFGLNANWKMSMFWQAGAANYLYFTVFLLLFLHVYLRELEADKEALPGINFWIIPLGLLAGWSNENMGPAVWVASALVILWSQREKRHVKLWMLLGNVACLIGSVVMILAPGNRVRQDSVASEQYGIWWRLFLRGYEESRAFLDYLFPAILLVGFLLFVSVALLHQEVTLAEKVLILTAILSWGAMVLSPHYPDRATFGTMSLLICVIVSLGKKIISEKSESAWPLWGVAFLVWMRGMYYLGEFLAICWGWIR